MSRSYDAKRLIPRGLVKCLLLTAAGLAICSCGYKITKNSQERPRGRLPYEQAPGQTPTSPTPPAAPTAAPAAAPAPGSPAPTPQAEPGVAAPSPAAGGDSAPEVSYAPQPSGGLAALAEGDRTRVMAALAGAAYCGVDYGCDVLENYEQNTQVLKVKLPLDGWQIEFISARDGGKDVEAYVLFAPGSPEAIISFRGSETDPGRGAWTDWVNINGNMASKYYEGQKFKGHVHQGLLEAMHGIWHTNDTGLLHVLKKHDLRGKQFWLTGHSQGAGLAALLAMRLIEDEVAVQGVVGFGMPRLGGSDFQASYNQVLGATTLSYVNQADPIPRLPQQFTVVGKSFHLTGGRTIELGKDGLPAFDLVSAGLNGNLAQHAMIDFQQGYFSCFK